MALSRKGNLLRILALAINHKSIPVICRLKKKINSSAKKIPSYMGFTTTGHQSTNPHLWIFFFWIFLLLASYTSNKKIPTIISSCDC